MRRRKILLLLVGVYLLALAASHLVRSVRHRPPPAGRAAITVPVVAADGETGAGGSVRLAYRAWPPGDDGAATPVLLLHGSPGSADDFDRLAPHLAAGRRLVAPDLPGFGGSTRRLPDYAARAHAGYALALLDALAIERAHVVGFSLGGAVALRLAARAPDRVRSLTLLSSVGVQELELLGNYHVNHTLHGLQLAALWLLHEATPHFGLLDGFALDVPYARNFFDTDQRPLAGILDDLAVPTLIVHGEQDPLVPWAAAREHHRLVPHSELVAFDGGHFLVFQIPDRVAAVLDDFVRRVDAGRALDRAAASAERRERAATSPARRSAQARGLALVLLVVLLAVATMASEDLTCITAGLLVARGVIGFGPAAAACATGIFVGDMLLYSCGRLGSRWLRRAPLRYLVSDQALARSKRWFDARGPMVIFASRFVPGLRVPTYVSAGLLRMPVRVYALWLLLPVAVWTPLVVEISRRLGGTFLAFFERYERLAVLGFVAALVSVWTALAVGQRLATRRGRRRLVGWWRRQTRWELWPPWKLYPPVVAYVLWLGLRHRCPTLFTIANPGLPAGGGLVGESKATILDAIDRRWVAPFERLPAALPTAERVARVRAFMAEHELGFPVVLKPDVGERGRGVVKADDDGAVEGFCAAQAGDALVQAYVAGPELGVLYARMPGAERGRIVGITEKRLPDVVGDGESTLETLILADPRAVALADVYARGLARPLDDVPAAGERVPLVEIGTHRLGAVFLDGERFRTEALEAATERISRNVDGFYFGRYDLRAPSADDLRAGRGLQVLELKGVSAEATHIYDPQHSLWRAYRILFAQWRLVFAIGAAHRDRGLRPLGVREVMALVAAWRRAAGGTGS